MNTFSGFENLVNRSFLRKFKVFSKVAYFLICFTKTSEYLVLLAKSSINSVFLVKKINTNPLKPLKMLLPWLQSLSHQNPNNLTKSLNEVFLKRVKGRFLRNLILLDNSNCRIISVKQKNKS